MMRLFFKNHSDENENAIGEAIAQIELMIEYAKKAKGLFDFPGIYLKPKEFDFGKQGFDVCLIAHDWCRLDLIEDIFLTGSEFSTDGKTLHVKVKGICPVKGNFETFKRAVFKKLKEKHPELPIGSDTIQNFLP